MYTKIGHTSYGHDYVAGLSWKDLEKNHSNIGVYNLNELKKLHKKFYKKTKAKS